MNYIQVFHTEIWSIFWLHEESSKLIHSITYETKVHIYIYIYQDQCPNLLERKLRPNAPQ